MFLFRREQRRAIQKAIKILEKIRYWDTHIPPATSRSRLSRTLMFPVAGNPSVAQYSSALEDVLIQAMIARAVAQNIPRP